jgi:hypothetical protein
MFGRLSNFVNNRRKANEKRSRQLMIEDLRLNTQLQVQEIVRTCGEALTQAELSEIDHFCYHNEYAEAVLTLARIIEDKKAMVPRNAINGIKDFLAGFAEAEFLPDNLDRFAVDDK